MSNLKPAVREFWDAAACGEVYAEGDTLAEQLAAQERARYRLEPYIADFARFEEGRGQRVLEVGVGMGADHARWAANEPAQLVGVDLTPRAVELTAERFRARPVRSALHVADAERLPFRNASFDLVYSWGVLHHSPDTQRAVDEVHRVLRPGGTARVMIYHSRSIVGGLLWLRYALGERHPFRTLADVYANHLESPGTKAYRTDEAEELFSSFETVSIRTRVGVGDLLEGFAGQRHEGRLLDLARRIWPRGLIRRWGDPWGLLMFIEARK